MRYRKFNYYDVLLFSLLGCLGVIIFRILVWVVLCFITCLVFVQLSWISSVFSFLSFYFPQTTPIVFSNIVIPTSTFSNDWTNSVTNHSYDSISQQSNSSTSYNSTTEYYTNYFYSRIILTHSSFTIYNIFRKYLLDRFYNLTLFVNGILQILGCHL